MINLTKKFYRLNSQGDIEDADVSLRIIITKTNEQLNRLILTILKEIIKKFDKVDVAPLKTL